MNPIDTPWTLVPYEFNDLGLELRRWMVFDYIVQTLLGPRCTLVHRFAHPERRASILLPSQRRSLRSKADDIARNSLLCCNECRVVIQRR